MKFTPVLLYLLLAAGCAGGKEMKYTGSTPADNVVRIFLGIPLSDSIDFIRWNLAIAEDSYTLQCNYGIGKPNTNGFINGGKKIELSGVLKKEKNIYLLQNGKQSLKLARLNDNLLHFLNEYNSLLAGNGGWSYTLNNLTPALSDQVSITATQSEIEDSLVFEGRTPCGIPGVIPPGGVCYKLKWLIILYANEENKPGKYLMKGTPWREEGGRKGTWKIATGRDGRIIYQLEDEKENPFIRLLKLDEDVVIFIDEKGYLLVGDLDFSYTLNRRK